MRNWKRIGAAALSTAMLCGSLYGAAEAAAPTARATGDRIFSDVNGKDTTEAVNRLRAAGIITGITNTTYHPNESLTRAEFMTMLGRAAGANVDHSEAAGFSDVTPDGWSSGYIAWGVENGLIEGIGDGKFGKNDPVTQEEVNLILDRYNQKFNTNVGGYPAPSGSATRGNAAVLLASGFTYTDTDPVEVTGGTITGYYSLGGDVKVYKGIPFAAPPVGDLRWKAPQPVEEWDGVRRCVNWSAAPIQEFQAPNGPWSEEFVNEDTGYSEDCLYLNVWTKDDNVKDKPVLVYYYGGAFNHGDSSCEIYNGEYLAQQDIVVVVTNYRVGALGFLATSELCEENENGVSGNYAMQDQVAALKWVQDNIEQFGGNPDDVTIMGQSAGSVSVNGLIQTPLAEGLFQKAVTMSGNTMNGFGIRASMEELVERNDEIWADYTLAEMREMTPDEIMEVNNSGAWCNDGYVFSEDYAKGAISGRMNDVILLSGIEANSATSTSGYMGCNTKAEYEAKVREDYGEAADTLLELWPATDENVHEVARQFYNDRKMGLQNILTQARMMGGFGDTYVYLFDHVMPGPESDSVGVFHTSDVPYFFNVLTNWRDRYWEQEDYDLGNALSSYLVNFVKTGNPNGSGLPQWDQDDGTGKYIEITTATGSETKQLSPEKQAFFTEQYADLLK